MKARILLVACITVMTASLHAGTTGKIAGRVNGAETGEPLVGISVRIEETTMGAATDIDGNFVIMNIPPGTYVVTCSGVGFQKKQFVNVKVTLDFTTRLDFKLSTDIIALDAVVVEAEAPLIRKDLTSSQTTVDASQIAALPVESVTQLLTLQAGIVQGAGGEIHIRGGRSTEISYTVNGISISNPFDNSKSVQIATNAIQELSVVSGTFNAEYGNALSGIVNTVTKEGGPTLRGSASFYTGDYVSNRTDVFSYIDRVKPLNHSVSEMTLSGPLGFSDNTFSFFVSGRYDFDKGWLYGVREHNPSDYIIKNALNPNDITVITTGDGAIVPMNPSKGLSATGKLAYAPTSTLKIKYDVLYSNSDYKSYNHSMKYNPDGNLNNYEWGLLNSIELRHALNSNTYYTLRGSYNVNDFKQFLFPLLDANGSPVNYYAGSATPISSLHADPRYEPDYKLAAAMNYTFLAGGTLNSQYYQRSRTTGAKFDITSQLTAHHEVKFGLDFKSHRLDYDTFSVLRDTVRYFVATIPDVNTPNHDAYTKRPTEFSAYAQDKMEFESLILNLGLRYDYFASSAQYSTDVFNPSPNIPTLSPLIDKASLLAPAKAKNQLSPRVGISFPITDKGIIHFSYGHFFQMPPFQYLYTNPDFKYSLAVGAPTFGNANLNPEKTVTYELGLQQQIMENLAFNVTGFYKDVRDLLALQQIRVSGDQTYYKYVNKDYGNIKGITFSLTKRRTASDLLGVTLDYTFQIAEGNDTNTDAFFLDLSSGRQSEKVPVYLGWDQTHTLNTTVTVGKPSDWNVTVVGRLGTGLPYTPQITSKTVYLQTNSGRKPSTATVDLLADKTFTAYGMNLTVFLKVFNLFDTLNERFVYDDTGRATYSLLQTQAAALETDKVARTIAGVHSAQEYFNVPTYYMPPREVRVGATLEF